MQDLLGKMSYAILAMGKKNSGNRDTQRAGAASLLSGSEGNYQGLEVQKINNNNGGAQPVAKTERDDDSSRWREPPEKHELSYVSS